MDIFNSILELSELTSWTPDTVLVLFANAILLYEIIDCVITGVVVYLTMRLLHWLWMRVKNRKKD